MIEIIAMIICSVTFIIVVIALLMDIGRDW
jgi:hypothetical protein